MSSTRQVNNPFMGLKESERDIIRDYFSKSEFADKIDFETYLVRLHEDDLSPREVLEIIEAINSTDKKTYSSVDDLLADLKSD